MSQQAQLVRPFPRISANKLGEYLVSPPLRRRDIIERQKYPCTFIGAYYEPARATIVDYLLGHVDRAGLLGRTEALVAAEHPSSWAQHQAHGCAEAVLRFLDLEPHLDLRGMTPVHVPEHAALDVEGVRISVYPDLVLEGVDHRGRRQVGALKLHFPKAHPHTETSAEYVATLLRLHAQRFMLSRGHVSEHACLVIDVFSGRIVSAPRGHVRRFRDIGAACDEIRRAWPDA
jgi:hypothetical protein